MGEMLTINPDLDVAGLAAEFAARGRLQVRDVLTEGSARTLQRLLVEGTPWGLAWQAGATAAPQLIRADRLNAMPGSERMVIGRCHIAAVR